MQDFFLKVHHFLFLARTVRYRRPLDFLQLFCSRDRKVLCSGKASRRRVALTTPLPSFLAGTCKTSCWLAAVVFMMRKKPCIPREKSEWRMERRRTPGSVCDQQKKKSLLKFGLYGTDRVLRFFVCVHVLQAPNIDLCENEVMKITALLWLSPLSSQINKWKRKIK